MQHPAIAQILDSPAWKNAPPETDPLYFRSWQRVSVALQRALRRWIPEWHFRDITHLEDRDTAYQFIVYAAARPCYGQPRTEFTYDIADLDATLNGSLRSIGRAMQTALGPIHQRLLEAGMPELSRRYAPVWHKDILRAVKQNPKRLIRMIASEARLVNAMIDLGTMHHVSKFERAVTSALRNVAGDDMCELGLRALVEASEVLAKQRRAPGSVDGLIDVGILEHDDARPARRPNLRIGGKKNRYYRSARGGSQVADAGIVPDVHAGSGKMASKPVQIADAHGPVKSVACARLGNPLNRPVKTIGEGLEIFKWPVFFRAS